MDSCFLGCGELWWVTSHPQGVESAQVIDIRPDVIEDLALSHIVQGWLHQVGVVGLHLPMLRKVTDIVSLAAQPAMPLVILL